MQSKGFVKLVTATLIAIYAVTMAGSLVRMTGSGMGCPDWPKCFGYLVPPTDDAQVQWAPGKKFKKGQFIVYNNTLFEAKQSHTALHAFNPNEWEEYTQHDYATFNAKHTWFEYGNRLVGALSGMFVLAQFIMALLHFIKRRGEFRGQLLGLAFILVPLMGFQAWLGKTVVDSNLAVSKITIHMFAAFLIIALQLLILDKAKGNKKFGYGIPSWLIGISLLVLLAQTYLGTQVREAIDVIAKSMDGIGRDTWISQLSTNYIVHRSFAWASLLLTLVIAYLNRKKMGYISKPVLLLLLSIVLGVVLGLIMAFFGIPAIAQPLHLASAVGAFSVLIYLLLSNK